MKLSTHLSSTVLVITSLLIVPPISIAQEIRAIEFPVEGDVTFTDDFGDPRSSGRTHEGIDLMGKKMMPLLSVIDGVVSFIVNPQAPWGYYLVLKDAENYTYHYVHINNDTPGTDDGNGGVQNAYAPGIEEGVSVTKGQHIAWMGDSGDAENAGPHLHFEIRRPDDTPINPYQSLLEAKRSGGYDPAIEMATSPSINNDRGLIDASASPACVSGSLIKSPAFPAAYYCGADGKRYVFPNQQTYLTWYTDFLTVKTITPQELAAIPLGKNVTYRPGTRLVKIQTDPKVYAVSRGGVLRWVVSPEIAAGLYGSEWSKKMEDIPEVFFSDYTIGEPITTSQ